MNTLGKRIRIARGNMSQEEYSKAINVSKGSLGFYERDENLPNSDVILKICSLSNILPEWLLMNAGPMRHGEALELLKPSNQPPPETAEQCPACPRCAKLEQKLEALEQKLEASEQERREIAQENRQLWKDNATIREQLARMDEYQKMRKHMQEGTTDSYVA